MQCINDGDDKRRSALTCELMIHLYQMLTQLVACNTDFIIKTFVHGYLQCDGGSRGGGGGGGHRPMRDESG